MNFTLSERVQAVKPSATLAITNRAAQMKAAGHDIIGLGAGEPDFDTPEPIKQAAIRAIQAGLTKYTAVDGTPALKKAIINKFRQENRLEYETNQILVSCGGKQSFYNLAQALLNPGDEVLIPVPYWVSYPDMCLLAGAVPVFIESDQARHFKISAEQLHGAITRKTRLIVINSPSNPSGIAYSLRELEAIGKVLGDHPDIVIATDDMYEHILWNDGFCNILNACPHLYDRTLVLNGVSKAYSMTGWRIGYAAGPAQIIKAMTTIQSQSTSNPTSISQAAAEAALSGDQSFIESMKSAFKQRHDSAVAALNRLPGVSCLPTDGTFYLFPDFNRAIADLGLEDDIAFSEYLIEKAGVAAVPGSAFGSPGHIRISIAIGLETLNTAIERIGNSL
ncbi:MAG: pyridoxal phosphate-dependent aminotransferase [Gammaproteobacteria bacterium]